MVTTAVALLPYQSLLQLPFLCATFCVITCIYFIIYLCNLMERDTKKIIKRLKREGWILRNIKGSHHQFVKNGNRLTIPHPKKDLPLGTAKAIARAAGWTKRNDK